MVQNNNQEGFIPSEGEMIYPSTPNDRLVFRTLRADEIEVRPCDTSNDKVKLLLYKNARVDMNILDETVGTLNWQKDYFEERGLLFCKVGIKHPETGEWIWKADTGAESNIEAEKGLASDSFKRAAFAFGIGRELYTAPRISIALTEKDMFNGKLCQTFKVDEMKVTDGTITELIIVDKWGEKRFEYNKAVCQNTLQTKPAEHVRTTQENSRINVGGDSMPSLHKKLKEFCSQKKAEPGIDMKELKSFYDWYIGPDEKDPRKSKMETLPNPIPEYMWKGWLKKKTQ